MKTKYLKSLFFILCSFLMATSSFSQDTTQRFSIIGKIVDSNNDDLPLADVLLFDEHNNQQLQSTVSEIDGSFQFKDLSSGRYNIRTSAIQMKDEQLVVNVLGQDAHIGNIIMNYVNLNELNKTTIIGDRIPVQQKGDTTQYDAGAYKANKDASAEDLLKKMPGMDMSSGNPKSQGEQVAKVLVDGKPFFGEDPTAALKNLPAEVIDKIQVYDEKSEQSQFTGFDDGNTSKTINIITRSDKKEGLFGRLYAGLGQDMKQSMNDQQARYNLGGNINYFKGDRRISLMGIGNNINIQNFQSQDLVGVSSGRSSGRGGGRPGGGADNSFLVDSRDGIAKTNSVGINYSDKFGKKVTLTSSYFFNNSNTDVLKSINRTYPEFTVLAGQVYDEQNVANTKNFNHRLNARIEYKIDSFKSLLIMPNLSYQTNTSISDVLGNTYFNQQQFINATNNQYQSDRDAYNATLRMLYRHRFAKKGRTFSAWLNGGINNNAGSNWLYALNQYQDYLLNDTLDQLSNLYKNGWNASANLTYTEPLSKKSALQIEYRLGYQNNTSDKRTWDSDPSAGIIGVPGAGVYNNLNTNLSSVFASQYLTNAAGLGYRFSDTKFNFNAGLNYQLAALLNQIEYPNQGDINRNFNNLLPNARFEYKISKSKSWRLFYRTNTNNPTVDQLQTVIDNSNPLFLNTGNADLKQTYVHSLRSMYSTANTKNSTTFFAMLGFNKTNNYIANSTYVASNDTVYNGVALTRGSQLIRPENMGGYYNINSFATYGMPIKFIKSNFNVNANLGYVRIPGLINSIKNYANTTNMGLGLVISSNISDKIDFTISTNGNYNIVRNTINTNSDNSYYIQTTRASLNYIFWKGIVLNTDVTNYVYTGLAEAFNQNFYLWNVGIGKKMFKDEQAEIRVSIYDLLGQNTSLSRTITETYVQDTRVNALQSYFMLTFSWNLRYFKGGATMKDGQAKDEFQGGTPQFRP